MLQCGEWKASNSYFKFENWWLQTEGFKEKIKTWWESFPSTGSPNFVLISKLRALKIKLKEWSKSTQGNLGTQKQLVLTQLADLEEIQEYRMLQEEEVVSRMTLINEFEEIAKKEEIAWRQRSRVTWLK